jgi:hypothetical protein
MESMGSRFLNRSAPPMKQVPSLSRPLETQKRLPRSLVMFSSQGSLMEPIRPNPPILTRCSKKTAFGKFPFSETQPRPSPFANPVWDITESLKDARKHAVKSVKDLGLVISAAIFAAQNTLKSKGLHFKKEGKFKQDWLLTWMRWYTYIRAMCMKFLNASSTVNARASSRARGEDAKTPFQ